MRAIEVSVERSVLEDFKRRAKVAFPRETMAYLIGRDLGDRMSIEGLYVPMGQAVYCSALKVAIPPRWEDEAREHARGLGAAVIGDIHSHPRCYHEWKGQLSERTPSETDHKQGWAGLSGICVVSEQRRGGLLASVCFYGPSLPVRIRILPHGYHKN